MQQLRNHRFGRHGSGAAHFGRSRGPRRGRHRPERAHHAFFGRNGFCGPRNGAPKHPASAAHWRRHHLPRTHRRQDSTRLHRPPGARQRRLPCRSGGPKIIGAGPCRFSFGPSRGVRPPPLPVRRTSARKALCFLGRGSGAAFSPRLQRKTSAPEAVGRLSVARLSRGRLDSVHRLDPLLPSLGPARKIPRNPERFRGGRASPVRLQRRPGALAPNRVRIVVDRPRGVRIFPGKDGGGRHRGHRAGRHAPSLHWPSATR